MVRRGGSRLIATPAEGQGGKRGIGVLERGKNAESFGLLGSKVARGWKEREAEKKRKENDPKAGMTLEEIIEEERAALPSEGLTPVTKESFFAWKAKRKIEKQEALEAKMKD